MDEQNQGHLATILKEISDIKANLAVNSSETSNIKVIISEIKQDIREIKSEAVSRIEFTDNSKRLNDHENRVRTLEAFRWQLLGGLITFQVLADYILYILLKH